MGESPTPGDEPEASESPGGGSASEPFAEFIDDYFMECDEHLEIARRNLLALEPTLSKPDVDRSLIDELFRSVHSIKGLSAMVGVHTAELLAHHMESYLSALRRDKVRLNTEGLETLILGVKTLEQIISARRSRSAAPDAVSLLVRFAELIAADAGTPEAIPAPGSPTDGAGCGLSSEARGLLESAVAEGAKVWQFTFTPSPLLAKRGVNVNSIRQRLAELGRLLDARPVLAAEGGISFSFLVASQAAASTFSSWTDDGLVFEPYDPSSRALAARAAESKGPVSRFAGSASSTITNVVRVDLARLDELMRLVGELVISRARLTTHLERTEHILPAAEWRSLQETNQALERQLRDLREGIMHVRMVPIREVFARMQFVVRDLTREHHKQVALILHGQETEIDKFIVERIMDPLLHLVRNAVSHGLELASERLAQGKPPEGRLELSARAVGETIQIEVADDGRGINAGSVFARARSVGLAGRESEIDPSVLLDILCAPGFSTRDDPDRASGRGIGMSVVREAVEELGGSLGLLTQSGRGTRFTIQLPLTLSIADALIVVVAGHTFAVPQAAIREVIEIEPASVTVFENNEAVLYRNGVLPLVRLSALFGLNGPSDRMISALVIGEGRSAVGIGIDRVLGLSEIVVRPLLDPLVRVPGIVGATELGDGRVVLILDTMALTRAARAQPRDRQCSAAARVSVVSAAPVRVES